MDWCIFRPKIHSGPCGTSEDRWHQRRVYLCGFVKVRDEAVTQQPSCAPFERWRRPTRLASRPSFTTASRCSCGSRPRTRTASSTSATRTTGRGPSPSLRSSPLMARRSRCGLGAAAAIQLGDSPGGGVQARHLQPDQERDPHDRVPQEAPQL